MHSRSRRAVCNRCAIAQIPPLWQLVNRGRAKSFALNTVIVQTGISQDQPPYIVRKRQIPHCLRFNRLQSRGISQFQRPWLFPNLKPLFLLKRAKKRNHFSRSARAGQRHIDLIARAHKTELRPRRTQHAFLGTCIQTQPHIFGHALHPKPISPLNFSQLSYIVKFDIVVNHKKPPIYAT